MVQYTEKVASANVYEHENRLDQTILISNVLNNEPFLGLQTIFGTVMPGLLCEREKIPCEAFSEQRLERAIKKIEERSAFSFEFRQIRQLFEQCDKVTL